MPTGTVKNYDLTKIHQGPGDLWVIGGGITDSSAPILTLASGTPDSTAHPGSVHLGSTESAITFMVKPKYEPIKVDQAESPLDFFLTDLEMSLEAELKQFDQAVLGSTMPFAVNNSLGGGTTGKGITFGGYLSTPTALCIACIAPKRNNPAWYTVALLFAAVGTAGLSTKVGRAKSQNWAVKFEAKQDLSRGAGRQTGIWYETLS